MHQNQKGLIRKVFSVFMVTMMAAQLFIPYAAASPQQVAVAKDLLFAKAEGSSTTSDYIKMTGIQVSPNSLAMTVGDTKSVSATIAPADSTKKDLTWTSDSNSVASVSASGNSGSITAKAAGSATITVSSTDGPSASVSVTVAAAPSKNVAVTSISLDRSTASLKVGESLSIKATVAPADATNPGYSWESSNASVAKVEGSGSSSSIKGVSAGTATITARTAEGNKIATCSVTVSAATTVNNSPVSISTSVRSDSTIRVSYNTPKDASSVRIQKSTSSNSGFSECGSPGRTDSYYDVTGLDSGTTYWFKVIVSGGANDGTSNTASATTTGSTTLTDKTPSAGAKSVSVSADIEFRFNKTMKSNTVNEDNVYLRKNGSGSNIKASVSYNSSTRRVTINPTDDLDTNTKYTVYATSSLRYDNGDSFKSESWDFTTSDSGNLKISEKSPKEDEKDVALDKQIRIKFSRDLNSSTVNSDNFTLRGDDGDVKSTVSYSSSGYEVTIKPKSSLIAGVKYTVTVASDVKDKDGNKISKTTWDFTAFRTKTTITDRTPAQGQSVLGASQVTFKFSNDMDSTSINSSTVFIKNQSNSMMVPCMVSYDKTTRRVTIVPTTSLVAGGSYIVSVTSSVKDDSRNSFTGEEWNFSIGGTAVGSPLVPVTTPVVTTQVQRGTAYAPIVKMNGQYVNFTDAKPYIKNKRTMLPMRTLFEMIGAEVQWDKGQQKVTATLNGNKVELFIGKKIAYKNGLKIALEAAPEINKGRTMVPLRFASESLGYQIGWDAKNYTVTFGQ